MPGQKPDGLLIAPPRLGLGRDQQERGLARLAGNGVVEPDLAKIGDVLRISVRHENVRVVSCFKIFHWVRFLSVPAPRRAGRCDYFLIWRSSR
jgi:hypothetical protein